MIINQELAMKADGSAYLSQGGVFTATITKAKIYSLPSGVKGIEFAFETSGGKCDFVTVMTKNKDGGENFNVAKIHALGTLLQISELIVKEGQITQFVCKEIGVALQREDYKKNDGTLGYRFNLLHFFDGQTMQTAREKAENQAPNTASRKIDDKRLSANDSAPQSAQSAQQFDDSLPF